MLKLPQQALHLVKPRSTSPDLMAALQSVIDALSDKKGDDGVLDAGAVKKSKKKRKRDTGGADASLEDPAAATPDLAPADAGEDAATAAEQPAAGAPPYCQCVKVSRCCLRCGRGCCHCR